MKRIALVSCVKSKQSAACAARDLYTSPLFRGLRRYALAHTDEWYILSAKHGLVSPDSVLEPYEATLNRMRKSERIAWAERVNNELIEVLPSEAEIILLAGEAYRKGIEAPLRSLGYRVTIPLEGKRMGEQLAWLKDHAREPDVG